MFLRLAIFCALAFPANAACVSYLSFAKGVEVKLEDGSVWTAKRDAHDVIRIDQKNGKGRYARYAVGLYGIYASESTRNGTGVISEFSYARKPVEPGVGMDWTSNVTAMSTKMGANPDPTRREKVHVTASDVATVRLGKCTYRVMGVDMGHLGGPHPTVQHFAYFPDLKFGIQTQITYPADTVKKAAVLAMWAK